MAKQVLPSNYKEISISHLFYYALSGYIGDQRYNLLNEKFAEMFSRYGRT